MTLRPAYETTLRHGDDAVTLRASLRAAVLIANMDGGFPAVLSGITSLTYGPVRAVILAAATSRHDAELFLAAVAAAPLRPFLEQAVPACVELIANILPQPAEAEKTRTTPANDPSDAKSQAWQAYLADLFDRATGWLGWTPATAWDASPAEIEAAFAAHCDRLIAMNGGKPEDTDDQPRIYTDAELEAMDTDPTFQRDKLRALKAMM